MQHVTQKVTPLWEIFCSGCNTMLFKYKKSGTGTLKNAIVSKVSDSKLTPDFKCPQCLAKIAMMRVTNGSLAWRLISKTYFAKAPKKD